MPELPEVETARRLIAPVLEGRRIVRVVLRRGDLRRPFPSRFAERVRGRTTKVVSRRGKYLLVELSSGETIVMHLGMSGALRVERGAATSEPDRHDHVIFEVAGGARVIFNDPRRFGMMDLAPRGDLSGMGGAGALGPEPLSPAFDGAALARACAGRRIALKVALLDQSVVAGVGNIYASDALNLARLSPRQAAGNIATKAAAPRPSADRLAAAIRTILTRAIDHQGGARHRGGRFRVYDQAGERCPNRGCGGVIRRFVQAARATFWCPVCQKRA